jgi:hypothetical protein
MISKIKKDKVLRFTYSTFNLPVLFSLFWMQMFCIIYDRRETYQVTPHSRKPGVNLRDSYRLVNNVFIENQSINF